MLIASASDSRKDLKSHLDRVALNYETLIVNRGKDKGIGKPEPLKHKYSGFWSRRIDEEHRLIYQHQDGQILIAKCRFHYD